ncbi:helix-turn-helix domain-containing protein [Litoribrevibacter albus]|uniref:HTH araC/xylS-type domain-containing protein n=1 Tax=Litoribrevibacter albus TaxID=1473156 RepID=A0AA37SAB3_9GAMM|nr:AraC family transcriptional regulator [Litoribrevibacter albus]GLQ32302.1 hypothetical protein GCM10007876_27810 [Litoribrevibacter albus]
MNLSLLSVVFLLGAAQGIFLALSLFTSKLSSHKANMYLGALTLVFVTSLFDYFLDSSGITYQHPWLRALFWPKEFFFGVCIYFYACHISAQTPYGRTAFHFIPAMVHILVSWSLVFLTNEQQLAILFDSVNEDDPLSLWAMLLGTVEDVAAMLHMGAYLVASLIVLKRHQLRISNEFSYTEKVSLVWLRNLILSLLGIYLLWLSRSILPVPENVSDGLDEVLGFSIVILIYVMGYLGLKQPQIFTPYQAIEVPNTQNQPLPTSTNLDTGLQTAPIGESELNAKTPVHSTVQTELQATSKTDEASIIESKASEKYKKSSLSDDLSASLAVELQTLMEKERPYLDSQLSLPQLAERMGISTNYLSQVINEQLKLNFFDFINQYRVNAAASSLSTTSDTVTDIALAVGFNSKSAFYAAFKKHQGQTPGEFRKASK